MAHTIQNETADLWWWLSFVDVTDPKGDQFLGVAIVPAPTAQEALFRAHDLGIYPGGEVVFGMVKWDHRLPINRLLNRDEAFSVSKWVIPVGEVKR